RIIPALEKGEEIQKSLEETIFTGDFTVDEKHRTITVTEDGWEKVEKMLGIGNIADPENWGWKHHVETAIKAHALYRRDSEYVVKDGEVIIVDEFTGRMMPGRRWSDGLHQAVEAKENVKIERENQTLATISFQNYFRMYGKLAGMTGTAETEAAEFERLSEMLKQKGVKNWVLNAKQHEREAEIVAQAGRIGTVTIATNMAGRGTDILLGGNAEFLAKQELLKKGLARSVGAAAGELAPIAANANLTRFYYQGAEYEVETQQWQEA